MTAHLGCLLLIEGSAETKAACGLTLSKSLKSFALFPFAYAPW